ncbi:ribonuclease R [Allofustis seminis]|uniref:ribonuclease R n=1 Tax=Allofustis seminis TaxID=166939 RepID=UPI000377B9A2|nr:ribonuclease R [Allofustis seminis]
MKKLKIKIIELLKKDPAKSLSVKDFSAILDMKAAKAFKKLVQALAELELERKIELLPDGSFALYGQPKIFTGIFRATDRGFGFVEVEDFEEDVFVNASGTLGAINGDTVEVEVIKEARVHENKSAEGRVVKIIAHDMQQIIGVFKSDDEKITSSTSFYGTVMPNDRKLQKNLVFLSKKGLHPVEGEVVLGDIIKYPDENSREFIIAARKILGHINDPGVEITSIALKHHIHTEFPPEVLTQLEKIPDDVLSEEYEGRMDYRDHYTVTIDGADAKDLDDAISIQTLNNGHFQLMVHIADVSYYVKEGTALDKEAYARGVSSYLVDRVIPMLPPKLSNGLCSLNPNVDRLTMTCSMEINKKGEVIHYDISPSVIHSNRRLTYDEVNELLSPDVSSAWIEEYAEIKPLVEQMAALHHILEKRRYQRGALSFESPEIEFELDEQGHPVAVYLRERLVAERLIESFMLVANETVAAHYEKQHLPFLYRVHEHPDANKMQRFITFASRFGLQVAKQKDQVKPKTLQKILEQVEDEPSAPVINMLLLRSMQQARYDVEPLGHYGLATEYYTHFTAPIRRYPDLIVHRLIHKYAHKLSKQKIKAIEAQLPEIADDTSVAERRAIDAEREVDDLKKAQYMADKIGEQYDGMIVSLTNFGMFVQLANTITGLVRASDMKDDYYEFIEEHLMMVGTRTGKVYQIGQPVKIKVTDVNINQYEIDFELIEEQNENKHTTSKNQKKKVSLKKPKDHQRKKLSQNKKSKKMYQVKKRRK